MEREVGIKKEGGEDGEGILPKDMLRKASLKVRLVSRQEGQLAQIENK